MFIRVSEVFYKYSVVDIQRLVVVLTLAFGSEKKSFVKNRVNDSVSEDMFLKEMVVIKL